MDQFKQTLGRARGRVRSATATRVRCVGVAMALFIMPALLRAQPGSPRSRDELVGWVVGGMFRTRKNKFHGAGREDVDVRMLGAGRPFVMEVINPKLVN